MGFSSVLETEQHPFCDMPALVQWDTHGWPPLTRLLDEGNTPVGFEPYPSQW